MNLQEIAAALPVKGLRAKLLRQEVQIKQLEEENRWLKDQIALMVKKEDKRKTDKHPHRF